MNTVSYASYFLLDKSPKLIRNVTVHSNNTKKTHEGYCVTCWPLTLIRIVIFHYEEKPALSRRLFQIGSETTLKPILI